MHTMDPALRLLRELVAIDSVNPSLVPGAAGGFPGGGVPGGGLPGAAGGFPGTTGGLGTAGGVRPLQLTLQGELAGRSHQLVIGASGDFGDTRFDQQSQPASFTPERNTIATGDFAPTTDVGTRNRYVGVFAADTLALDERWTLTLAGRYNRARIDVGDRSGRDSRLDSRSTFARFNPAIGLNYNPVPDFTGYAAYNEGMRAPSPVELTCANAAAPCKLPNIFLSDPPLKQVVSRTVELGARGTLGPAAPWSAALYRTDLDNDIQFIAAGEGALNAGFFQNVGKTRRQGIELAASRRFGELSARNLLQAIAASKERPFARVLFALGIEEVGEVTARNLAQRFREIDSLLGASEQQIVETPGIGEKMASVIREQLDDERMRVLIEDLRDLGLRLHEEGPAPSQGPLAGKARTISLGTNCDGTLTAGPPGKKPTQF